MHSVRGRVEKNGTNAIFKETMRTFQNNEKQNPTDSEFQQTPSRDKYTWNHIWAYYRKTAENLKCRHRKTAKLLSKEQQWD